MLALYFSAGEIMAFHRNGNDAILSLSFDPENLRRREGALRVRGFDVKSIRSLEQARFEIETGRYGVLVTCGLIPDIVNQDLIELFKKSCPEDGLTIIVDANKDSETASSQLQLDVRVPKWLDPEGIVNVLRRKTRGVKLQAEGLRYHAQKNGTSQFSRDLT
jgi:DNA-binding NtrC family response regulator